MSVYKWQTDDFEFVETVSDEDIEAVYSTWYARDFLEFFASVLWATYPQLRPVIRRAADACWRIWEEKYAPPGERLVFLPPEITAGRRIYDVIHYYLGNLKKRAPELINRLFNGTVLDVIAKEAH